MNNTARLEESEQVLGCLVDTVRKALGITGPVNAKDVTDGITALQQRLAESEKLVAVAREAGDKCAEHARSLESRLAAAESALAETKKALETEKYLSEAIKRADCATSPCGHNQQYLWSPDGVGKTILCLACLYPKAESALKAAEEALKAVSECRLLYAESMDFDDHTADQARAALAQVRAAMQDQPKP